MKIRCSLPWRKAREESDWHDAWRWSYACWLRRSPQQWRGRLGQWQRRQCWALSNSVFYLYHRPIPRSMQRRKSIRDQPTSSSNVCQSSRIRVDLSSPHRRSNIERNWSHLCLGLVGGVVVVAKQTSRFSCRQWKLTRIIKRTREEDGEGEESREKTRTTKNRNRLKLELIYYFGRKFFDEREGEKNPSARERAPFIRTSFEIGQIEGKGKPVMPYGNL